MRGRWEPNVIEPASALRRMPTTGDTPQTRRSRTHGRRARAGCRYSPNVELVRSSPRSVTVFDVEVLGRVGGRQAVLPAPDVERPDHRRDPRRTERVAGEHVGHVVTQVHAG